MGFFEYGKREIEYLRSRDAILGKAMEKIGMIRREINPDAFSMLINSIVGQQISGKAAETVWNRLMSLCGEITPYNIEKLGLAEIQSCGMSMRKAGYIMGIAHAARERSVDFNALAGMADKEIINTLTKLSGVGVWTVEMLLIFSLGRPDIVSFNDFGIRKGMMKLYGLESLSKGAFHECRQRYSPHGTVASFYLWAIAAM